MSEQTQKRQVGVCLLCGLPGSGKSTLARSLSSGNSRKKFAVIPYDNIITAEAILTSLWKQHRQHLLENLEQFFLALLNFSTLGAPESSSTDGTWYHFVQSLEEQGLISSVRSHTDNLHYTVMISETDSVCLVLDDNFYYQSMRYEVYQLARKYSLGFCQLYLHCPVEICLQRNKERPVPVPEDTIRHMEKKIEKPNPEKNSWEQNSLTLDSSQHITAENERIIQLINQAMANPLRPLQEDSEIKEIDRTITAANILHQADQNLRRYISDTMKMVKGAVSAYDLRAIALEFQSAKAKVLEDLRQSMSEKNLQPINDSKSTDILAIFKEQTNHIVQRYVNKEKNCYS
ncbi:hypothetical protein GDO86_013543 [Hymenochirus boettgeri]|uniref:L-seryl-tRNA(Sec) kinase n=1 Tax=Hymenochirus boettgeri TaxID=247094 RepID=A0A8T2IZ00_9PIPI|nr:hypothetical protein GDO86_013543 [Hymenochirus boettgeri]